MGRLPNCFCMAMQVGNPLKLRSKSLETTVSESRSSEAVVGVRGPWGLAAAGLILFYLAWLWQGNAGGLWLPGLGLGIALVSWLGWRILPLCAIALLLARWQTHREGEGMLVLADVVLHSLLIGISWWLYHDVAQGSRWLDDPHSATIFLMVVPGALAALTAVLQALIWKRDLPDADLWKSAAEFWLSRMTGILVVVPFLIVVLTPVLLRYRLLDVDLPAAFYGERGDGRSRFGDRIELAGLTLATVLLALLLLLTHLQQNPTVWMLWASCLVLIVWTCIRQGLRGGCFSAGVTSTLVLIAAQFLEAGVVEGVKSGIQGHLLAFCSSALLVGVSASWIRANETRYRQVVSRIPFVVYSVRLPHGIPAFVGGQPVKPGSDSKIDVRAGPAISKLANVVLVSPACEQVLGSDAPSLTGPFTHWLDRILTDDHEVVIASLAQLCLQKQPVTCEYRLRDAAAKATNEDGPQAPRFPAAPEHRWVRDTLTPHYSEEGLMDGWEGLVEDITEQRALSQNLRRLTNMLQVLITNLPTGVYFVQAPQGYPLLVNARARQLLGRREDLSAALSHLSSVYRLHRPDGAEYPWEELPVAKALNLGVTCRANDIILHRPDGRKVPLITWAAPIDLSNTGKPDAAVWVLEDWTAMQQAEVALRESELRLRAIIETMVEGVIVQDGTGVVIDGNAAACAILSVTREQLLGRVGLVTAPPCVSEDRSLLPENLQPDRQALRSGQAVRDAIIGIPGEAEGVVRWLLVNSLPLPVGAGGGLNQARARVVTTFADITQQVQAQDSLRLTLDKYQALVDTLPFMLLQRNRDFYITYLNPAATQLTGHTADEMKQPDFCQRIVHPDDLVRFEDAANTVAQGNSARIEARFYAKDKSLKTVLAFFHPNFLHGEVIGSTTLVVDITMQRRLEEELLQAKHLELIGRLASGTVHDFNNLLQVLMGTAGLAKTEVSEQHPIWQHLTRIEDIGEQAAHLAGQILTFSKQRPRQTKAVDLNALVVQTVKLAKSVLPSGIAVEKVLDSALPKALGDENPLRQVLMNLCLNARDAMPAGGTLTIRTDVTAAPQAARPNSGSSWVHLAIEDTGIGMNETVRSRVFEPFFSTKERGTGLGLAVVQQIVKELGGTIEVWSQPGVGTRFDIWLLRAPD